jgi:hypothetical protein
LAVFLDRKTTLRAAQAGARALRAMARPDGLFLYRYRDGSRDPMPPHYNALRHFGASWAMLDVASGVDDLTDVADAAHRAAQRGLEAFAKPFGNDDRLCLVDAGKIKLGGNGLALLAIEKALQRVPDSPLRDAAAGLAAFIISQQRADGDFVHTRQFPIGVELDFRSNYYTGQALLGLFCATGMTGDRRCADAALHSLAGLAARDYGVAERSHWMMYALERAVGVADDSRWRDLARKIAARITAMPETELRLEAAPLACNCEALVVWNRISERSADPADQELRPLAKRVLRRMLRKLLALQTRDGGFRASASNPEIRIDYIQHAISALVGYARQPSLCE